ncbi:MAG: beta-ketoacyl-ACP synthase II [Bacteroidota bacterium]
MKEQKVVVTGMGALTPIGNNVSSFLEGLKNGVSGAQSITYFDTEKFKTRFACELKGFNIKDHLDRKEIRTNDPYLQYALVSTQEALDDAAFDFEKLDMERVGVIWGTGNGGIQSFYDEVLEFAGGDGTPRYNPYFVPKIIVNMASGVISIKYGFKGISFTPVSACATGNSAIIEAANNIKWGKADVIVVGGSDAAISPAGIAGFNANKALSTRNEHPATASRPFDQDRDGFVMGEGSGTLILESLAHAEKRGAKVYAEVAGGAMTSDAYHLTATHPEGEGAQRAMRLGLQEAELSIEDVDYINVHATSTPMGDMSELKAISAAVNGASPKISATKSMTGHLLGAAGCIEAIASILAINHSFVPPTINTENLDENTPEGLDLVLGEAQGQEVNVVMSNTFGFGGHNAIALFRKFKS